MNAREVAERLARQAESVAQFLLPGGKRVGAEWRAGSVSGESGDSLGVHLTGAKAGVWRDFAAAESGGDLLDLWAQAKGVPLAEALKQAREYLGIDSDPIRPAANPRWRKPERPAVRAVARSRVEVYLQQVRKLPAESIKAYRIVANDKDDAVCFPSLVSDGGTLELRSYKFIGVDRQPNGKKVVWKSVDTAPHLFGWQAIPDNARSVVITEGEIDAVTMHAYGFPALSVPNGALDLSWIDLEYPALERFSDIVLAFDEDDAGRKHLAEISRRLGIERCRVARLPHKDANECLTQGVTTDQMRVLIADAKPIGPKELTSASDHIEDLIQVFSSGGSAQTGIALPWQRLDDRIRLRDAELSVWTGFNGHGKSLLLSQVCLHAIHNGVRACVFSGEMPVWRTMERMARQIGACERPSEEYIREGIDPWWRDKLYFVNVRGSFHYKKLVPVLEYAWKRYGVTLFVVDSLATLGVKEDDIAQQKEAVDVLCDFRHRSGGHVALVAHPRKQEDEGRPSGKMDVRGSGSLTDLADTVMRLWRNTRKEAMWDKLPSAPTKDEEMEKYQQELARYRDTPDAFLGCLKQRNGEWTGEFGLWFDPRSMRYRQNYHETIVPYVTGVQVYSAPADEVAI